MNFDKWTSRASKHGLLMGRVGITENQEATLVTLDAKTSSGKELTKNQKVTYADLMDKKLNPELPKTAQSELRDIYRETTSNRRSLFTNKHIVKGNREEQSAISLLANRIGIPLSSYKGERKFNEYFEGMPDVCLTKFDTGFDTKCSFGYNTFPWADDELEVIYEWQNLIYMDLYGKDRWVTAKCLVNCDEKLLMNEVTKHFYAENRPDDLDPDWIDIKKTIERNMIFDMDLFIFNNPFYSMMQYDRDEWYAEGNDMPEEKRTILFVTERDEDKLKEARERVKMCRSYLNSLEKIERKGIDFKIDIKKIK
tara:strand:+ start:204 stop:1133 length:930 start_codon:yes stop_codon:yes gene_type:complete